MSIWREPGEETNEYPGLWVHDGRVAGSITIGRTRLPISAIIGDLVAEGWPRIAEQWDIPDGFSEADLAAFLYALLDVRGELARLLLTLASAEKAEIDLYAEDWSRAWWEDERKQPVVEALRRCLAALEDA